MTVIAVKRLDFARGDGDYLVTNRVRLDGTGVSYRMSLLWFEQSESWVFDMSTSTGQVIVSGAWPRDRVDCLLGISSPGRPPGGIMAYDPKQRGNPGRNAWGKDGVLFLYVPGGLNPDDFTLYQPGPN